ncbi:MAG: 3-oxoacyl-ACP reductase family protein [Candidatus Micrarchaeota archaeon]
MKFENKVVLVTGAGTGIGKATALAFGKEGAIVVVNYNTSRESAESVVEEIKKLGGKAISIKCDVADTGEVKQMFEKIVKEFGRLDILVNNAALTTSKNDDFLSSTIEDWEKMFRTNVLGTFLCSQAAAKLMLSQKNGKIINFSSIRGLDGCGRKLIDYAASKAAIINFTKTLAKQLAPTVNVNCIAPGWTATETNLKRLQEPAIREDVERTYLKRMAQPEEIANAVLFLASDDASYITGQVLIVDGGYSLK